MLNLLRTIQKNLIWAIPLVLTGGFLYGMAANADGMRHLVLPFTFLMVYPMMVPLPLRKVMEKGDLKLQLATQVINFTVIPGLAFGMGRIFFPQSPYLALGLLLASLLPTSGMTISWTGMARGNVPASVKMTVLGLIAGSLLTPLYIEFLMGTHVEVSLPQVFKQIGLVVALPLALGQATQRLLIWRHGIARFQKDIKGVFPLFSTLGVLGVVFVAMALKARSVAENPGQLAGLFLPLLILYGINFVLSTLVGRWFFNRDDAIALVYGTVMRNLSIALAIAMTAFGNEGSQAALILALAYIVQVQSAAWYVRLTDRIFGPEVEEAHVRDVMQEGVFALHTRDQLAQALRLLAEEHIHSLAVLDDAERPVGMLSTNLVINALADGMSGETMLSDLSLEPVVLASPGAPLREILTRMKRQHEYKALVLDSAGKVTHVVTSDDLLQRYSMDTA